MSEGFEVEYFSDVGTGPRYAVDADTGEIRRDDVFMHGEGPVANSDTGYPGEPSIVTDEEAAEEAYRQILGSGLEPGQFYIQEEGDRSFRVELYGEDLEEAEEVDSEFVQEAVETLEDVF